MTTSRYGSVQLPDRSYGRVLSVQEMISKTVPSSPEVDAVMSQLVRSHRGFEQPAMLRVTIASLEKAHLELVAEAILAVTEVQELREAQFGTAEENLTKRESFTSMLNGGRNESVSFYPYDQIFAAIFSDSSKFDLMVIRDLSCLTDKTSDLLNLCHVLRGDGIPVTKENVENQLLAKAIFDRSRKGLIYDDIDKDYYSFPGIRKAIHDHMDRVEEVIEFARERGSVQAINEYFKLESAISGGAL